MTEAAILKWRMQYEFRHPIAAVRLVNHRGGLQFPYRRLLLSASIRARAVKFELRNFFAARHFSCEGKMKPAA
jgi:hypothetical protein